MAKLPRFPKFPVLLNRSSTTPPRAAKDLKSLICVECDFTVANHNEYPFESFENAIHGVCKMGFGHIDYIQNLFSTGCKNLYSWQVRGLERIALRRDPIEIHQLRGSRFFRHREFDDPKNGNTNLHPEDYGDNYTQIDFGIGLFKKGNILIVGDRPGPDSKGENIPFVGTGCGSWLLKNMEKSEIDERKLYWINAKDNFGVVAPKDFLSLLQPSKIICLGSEAAKWAIDISDEYEIITVPHPQYWRRFKNNERYPLLDLLK